MRAFLAGKCLRILLQSLMIGHADFSLGRVLTTHLLYDLLLSLATHLLTANQRLLCVLLKSGMKATIDALTREVFV